MADQGIKTPLEPGFIARVAAGVRYVFAPKAAQDWFGPQEPIQPAAPPAIAGRAFDYPIGYNLQIQPRAGEAVNFAMLRALAENHDVTRLAIETRKDQLVKLKWDINAVEGEDLKENDKRRDLLKAFLRFPDGEHDWHTWLRMLMEDVFVIDAPTVYVRRDMSGGVYALEIVDGATIKRVIDGNGRTPPPPDPAYQQVLKGISATNYTTEELIYKPRNLRPHKLYGYSPVEQILMVVNISLRRQLFQLNFYTDGNVPEGFAEVPADWNPDQIATFQKWWDSILSGNLEERRRMRFIPAGTKPIFPKLEGLKDDFDEWLARLVCYCFSLPPTPFVKQMNRAVAATAQEAALQEGLAPLMQWIKDLMNYIIRRFFGFEDLEFVWEEEKDIDPQVQANIDASDVSKGIATLDEVREKRGLPAYENGIGAKPLVYTASGAVLLEEAIKPPEPVPAALAAMPPGNEPPPEDKVIPDETVKLEKAKKKLSSLLTGDVPRS